MPETGLTVRAVCQHRTPRANSRPQASLVLGSNLSLKMGLASLWNVSPRRLVYCQPNSEQLRLRIGGLFIGLTRGLYKCKVLMNLSSQQP